MLGLRIYQRKPAIYPFSLDTLRAWLAAGTAILTRFLGRDDLISLFSEGGQEQIEVGTRGAEAKLVGRLVEIRLHGFDIDQSGADDATKATAGKTT